MTAVVRRIAESWRFDEGGQSVGFSEMVRL